MGQIPTLVVSSADLAKQVLKTHDIDFANRGQGAAARIIFYGCKDIFASDYGENWRQKRKLCALQLLSLKMVRSFQFIGDDEIQDLISNIRETYWRSNGSCCVIMKHKEAKKDDDDERKDFVDILLQTGHQLDFELDQDSFKAILMDMFLAGNDTTSTTME
ncbi:cytochrome P450 71A1-like [Neltuma alba]|uniref:cytochrome P450 71A1-like n=1 Tax=Neltuma alba TaxID=207710 RepID=UPI0010A4BE33|nr:cytochrome P450 71A1-like [Prosopis alba]